MRVRQALAAFGTEMRVQLIHHYWRHPGSQIEAAETLGLKARSVGESTRVLVDLGVLSDAPSESDARARVYTVNTKRVAELRQSLADYLTPPTQAGQE